MNNQTETNVNKKIDANALPEISEVTSWWNMF